MFRQFFGDHRRGLTLKVVASSVAVMGGVLSATALPAAASAAPVVANGSAAYTPGTTSPPNQFNVLTLVSGGAASVNTSSLLVVSQPGSGSAIVSTTASSGIITYSPTAGTTGDQTLTFAYCAPGFTYPSPGNCTSATLTYAPTTAQYFGGQVEGQSVDEGIDTAVTVPASVVQGSAFTMTVAPAPSNIPSSESGVTVNSASKFSLVMPVPSGFTYVPDSISVAGGDINTAGNFSATYCTAPVANVCTAQIASGNYKTVYPYIETYLATTIAGGNNVTLPTVTAQFTASGSVDTVVPVVFTEFYLTTSVQIVGSVNFDGFPSCASCGSSNPPTYSAPVAQATTTITAPVSNTVAVTGLNPGTGSPSGGTAVTLTGTDLGNATAVDFGPGNPGNITADSATSITVTSPSGTGTVDVTVTTPDGTSAISPADQFTYTNIIPPPTLTGISPVTGPVGGGTAVTLTGTDLGNATAVDFGPGNPGNITADSATSVTATAPAGTGTVDVTVTTPTGTTTPTAAGRYSYGAPVLTQLGSWTDTSACGIQSTVPVPSGATSVNIAASGGIGGGGGGAASSNSGGSGGAASAVAGTFAIIGGQLTAVTGCAGATAPHGSGVVSTGGVGGLGYSNGGGGGNGYYCAGINASGVCIGSGGADGSGGGGGGSTAVCVGASCQVGVTPLVVAAGGGGGGESMCAGSGGGGGGTGGAGSSTSSVDLTGAGNSGTNGGMGATSGDVGGTGGVNNTGGSASGTPGGPGSSSVSFGDSAGNGGGGGGYVGGTGSTATAGVNCGAGGGGGAGASWALNGSGAAFTTTSAAPSVSLAFFGFVGTSPSVTAQPDGLTVNAGQTATFTAAGTGNPSPAVQWQVSTDGGTTFTSINGATSPSLSFAATSDQSGNQYRAIFTNSVGTQTSAPATLNVDSAPVVTSQPSLVVVAAGQTAVFNAGASGSPTPTVQWQVSTDGGTTFSDLAGATSDVLVFTTVATQDGNQYQAVFTNSVGSVTSDPAALTVETLPTVTTQPSDQTVAIGHTTTFTAAGTGNPTPTLQWQVSTDGGTTFTPINGATSSTYTVTGSNIDNGYVYRALFVNPVGSTPSDPATLTVLGPLAISTTSLHSGTKNVAYSFTLQATGGTTPYAWKFKPETPLPAGLTLNPSTGIISGTPTVAGTFTITIKVKDASSPTREKAKKTFTLVIAN